MLLTPLAAFLVLQADPDLDAAVKKLYSVISGPPEVKRDWDAFRAIFVDGAQMRSVGKTSVALLTPEVYVAKSGPVIEKNGFFEQELSRKSWVYGNIAQVWSTYESRLKSMEEKPFDRGINTITLVKSDGKWKIASITWTSERVAGPLPAEFVKGG